MIVQLLSQLGIAFVVALIVTVLVSAALAALARRGIDPVGRIAAWLSPNDERTAGDTSTAAMEA